MKQRSVSLAFLGSKYGAPIFARFVADNADHNVRILDGYNTFHGIGIISACLHDGNFAAVNPKLPRLKSWTTAKNLCSGQGIPIHVYSKMFGVGIDHLDLKSVHSLMQPVVLPPVVNAVSVTYAWPRIPNQTGLDLCRLCVWENTKVQVKLTCYQ